MKRFLVLGAAILAMVAIIALVATKAGAISDIFAPQKTYVLVAARAIEANGKIAPDQVKVRAYDAAKEPPLPPGAMVDPIGVQKDKDGKILPTKVETWAIGRVSLAPVVEGQILTGDALISFDMAQSQMMVAELITARAVKKGEPVSFESTIIKSVDKDQAPRTAILGKFKESLPVFLEKLGAATFAHDMDPNQAVGVFDLLPPGYKPEEAKVVQVAAAPECPPPPVQEQPKPEFAERPPLDPADLDLDMDFETLNRRFAATPDAVQLPDGSYDYVGAKSGTEIDIFVSDSMGERTSSGIETHTRRFRALKFFYYYRVTADGPIKKAWVLTKDNDLKQLDKLRAQGLVVTAVRSGQSLPALPGAGVLCAGDVCWRKAVTVEPPADETPAAPSVPASAPAQDQGPAAGAPAGSGAQGAPAAPPPAASGQPSPPPAPKAASVRMPTSQSPAAMRMPPSQSPSPGRTAVPK